MAGLGRTPGHVHQNPNSIRFVDRTAYIGRFVPRNSGVVRRSKKVLLINDKFTEIMGGENGCASEGIGKGWHEHLKAVRACALKHANSLKVTADEEKDLDKAIAAVRERIAKMELKGAKKAAAA